MYKFKKVIVALDLSEHDKFLIDYTLKGLQHYADLEDVYFLHVVKDLSATEIKEKFNGEEPVDEQIKVRIKDEISQIDQKNIHGNIHIEVHEGEVAETILKWAKIKNSDLIVLGKKYDRKHTEEVPKHITRLAKCSILIVPNIELPEKLNKIVIAIDFSDLSAHAIHQTISLSQMMKEAYDKEFLDIELINVYEVPTGYHTTGKTFDEFAEIIKSNHEKEFERFIKKHKLETYGLKCNFLLDENNKYSKCIAEYVEESNASGIVIGSKGRTNLAAVFLGSVAENLLDFNHEIPFTIIKNKEDNYDFFDAILEL